MPPPKNLSFLERLGLQKQDESAEGETAKKFYNRSRFGDTLARLGKAANSLNIDRNEGYAQRMDAKLAASKDKRASNETAKFLTSKGREDLAKAILAGSITGKQAFAQYKQEEATEKARKASFEDQSRLARLRASLTPRNIQTVTGADGFVRQYDPATKTWSRIDSTSTLKPSGTMAASLQEFEAWKNEPGNEDKGLLEFKKEKAKAESTDSTNKSAQMQLYDLWSNENPSKNVNDFLKVVSEKDAPSLVKEFKFAQSTDGGSYDGTLSDFIKLQSGKANELTKGQIESDKKFAAANDKWTSGGKSDAIKLINQLESVSGALASGKNITGPAIGAMPDFLRAVVAPSATQNLELAQEVAARNLKEILGGQFAQKEGENLLARVYNPSLEEGLNAIRINSLMDQMKSAAIQRESKSRYFNTNGTLLGWTAEDGSAEITLESIKDIFSNLDEQMGVPSNQSKNSKPISLSSEAESFMNQGD